MEWSKWNATVGPKVRGTWNLHDVLADQPLDFFWMASSIVTVADEAGQSNYSAACNFLEAFCQYRHSLGLPATVLNICPIGGVGYVAENAHARRSINAQGLYTLGEHEFLDFVQHNILAAGAKSDIKRAAETGSLPKSPARQSWGNPNQVVMGLRTASDLHIDDPNSRTNWRRDRRMGRYHNIRPDVEDKGSSSGASRLALFLDSIINTDGDGGTNRLADPEVVAFLAREIGAKIYELMLKPVADGEEVDTRLTLAQIGLDSLMAIELRRWLRRVFGIVISVLEIMGSGLLIQLGGVVGGKLAEKLAKE
jgi:aryl carrier-like protein